MAYAVNARLGLPTDNARLRTYQSAQKPRTAKQTRLPRSGTYRPEQRRARCLRARSCRGPKSGEAARSQNRDLAVVAHHEAVGARLTVVAGDGDVAAQQRGLHPPLEVVYRAAREQEGMLHLVLFDGAALADRAVRADVGVD